LAGYEFWLHEIDRKEKTQMRLLRLLPILILLGGSLLSQTAPPPPAAPPAPPKISELSRLRLLSSYKTALIAQQNFNATQQAAQKALADWTAASAQVIEDEKLAKGTSFQVD